MRTQALSDDGFIIDQRELFDAPFGCRSSDVNGCGWIACYNLLRALFQPAAPEALQQELTRRSLFRGRLGSSPFKVRRCLTRRGFRIKTRLFASGIAKSARVSPGGILLYRHRGGWHYAAFEKTGQAPSFRFFNVLPGAKRHIADMEEFLKSAPVSPFMLGFIVET